MPERPGRTLELGCSIGVFTEMLAPRCDSLLAVDFSRTAVAEARRRLSAERVGRASSGATLPEQMPEGPFDTIVCSELLYYWSAATGARGAAAGWRLSLADGGTLARRALASAAIRVASSTGTRSTAILARELGLRWVEGALEPGYVLDRLERSVSERRRIVIVGGGPAAQAAAAAYREAGGAWQGDGSSQPSRAALRTARR